MNTDSAEKPAEPVDLDPLNTRLDAFKSRFSRDDWVCQAKVLRKRPDAAAQPCRGV